MTSPVLEVMNLYKRFGAVIASDDVSLDLFPGEIHALIGPNGAGKSTLIKQITGEMRQDSGAVVFCGRDISQMDPARRVREGMARSFQISSLVPDYTAFENAALAVQGARGGTFRFFQNAANDAANNKRAHECLNRVGLEEFSQTPACELSHGHRRQLEIAMALALDAKVFLLDEPMAGMGPEGSLELTRFLDGLRAQAPILLVEHDMDAVFALADRITVLVYGRVIATGSVSEIRSSREVREAYLGTGVP
jgi:branched-chain amino acid transport system ATP-binding protein